jgi:predicted acetyltransferase
MISPNLRKSDRRMVKSARMVDTPTMGSYDGLDSYWREQGQFALTTHADGRLAGFILVNRWSALNRQLDHSVGEFFVLRKYRRLGVGLRAAKILFERWPGRWEVGIAGYNKPALSFWQKAIPAAVDGDVEECAGAGFRFFRCGSISRGAG